MTTDWITPDGGLIDEAADANFLEHASWIQRATPGMSVDDDGTLAVIDSGLPCDTFNLVCRARLSDAGADGRVRAALDHFRGVRRPFSWWVSPADRPRSIGELLQAAGFQRFGTITEYKPPASWFPEA